MSETKLGESVAVAGLRVVVWGLILLVSSVGAALAFAGGTAASIGTGLALVWFVLAISPLGQFAVRRLQINSQKGRLAFLFAPPVLMVIVGKALAPDARPIPAAATHTLAAPARADPDTAIYPALARKMLTPHLRDPESAQLTELIAYRSGNRLTLCGKVNAKNGFGGYAGAQPFIISDEGVFVGDIVTGNLVLRLCNGEKTTVSR